MKYKFLIYLTCILLLTSCTKDNKEIIENKDIDTKINIGKLQKNILTLNDKIKQLEEENKSLSMTIDDLVVTQYGQGRTDYKFILENSYYIEDEIQTMLGYRHYNGIEPLRVLPYSDATQVNSGYPSDIEVISTVRNSNNEQWALVEFYDHSSKGKNNYGFVKVEYIEDSKDVEEDHANISVPIGIQGIHIGDVLEKSISILGIEYWDIRGFDGNFIHYDENEGSESSFSLGKGIDIFYDSKTHSIWGIRFNAKKYYTTEGYGIGSNAVQTVEYYKSKYPMNGDVNFEKNADGYGEIESNIGYWSFDIGDNYILKLEINTEELTQDSIIIGIELMPIWKFFI